MLSSIVLLVYSISYESSACHLKALRTEIEHLQLLLERAKVKLHKDFQKWWNEEASNVQVSEPISLLYPSGKST